MDTRRRMGSARLRSDPGSSRRVRVRCGSVFYGPGRWSVPKTHDGVLEVTIPLPREAKKEAVEITPTAA